jgi:hypothetical protein
VRVSFREIKIADYARRRDPRASLGRGVRPSPISTERGGRQRESQLASGRPTMFWKARSALQGRPRSGYRTRTPRSQAVTQCAHMPVLLFILGALGGLVAAVVGPIYLDLIRRELSRSERIEGIAGGLGLAFSPADPAYPSSSAFRYPFELFSRGFEQTCENFMTGSIDMVDLVAFDFLFRQRVDSDGDPENDVVSEPQRYSCALTRVGGDRPPTSSSSRPPLRAYRVPTASPSASSGETSTRAIASSRASAASRPPSSTCL